MAYYAHVPIDLGSDGDGKTLTANLYPPDSATATETDVGTVTEIDGGVYIWEYDSVPEGFNGCVVFLEGSTPQAVEKLTAPDDSMKYLIHAMVGTTPDNVIYVAASGGSDSNAGTDPRFPKATVEDAVENATAGQTVLMLPGVHEYDGDATPTTGRCLTVPAGVRLKGCGANNTTIEFQNIQNRMEFLDGSIGEDFFLDSSASFLGGIVQQPTTAAGTFYLNRVNATADTYGLWLNGGANKHVCFARDCEFYGGIGGANISSQNSSVFHDLHLTNCLCVGDDALQVLVSDAVTYGIICVRGRVFAHNCTLRGFHSDADFVSGGILCGDPPGLTDRGDGQAWLMNCNIESKHSAAGGEFWDLRARIDGSEIYFENCTLNLWSILQEDGGRIFSTQLNIHDKVSILQGGRKIYYANPDDDYSSTTPTGRGLYVRDGYSTIQDAVDECEYGETVYAMPGHSGEQFSITGSINMADGVELHGIGIDRTKITYTGTGEGDSTTNPAIVLNGTNKLEDFTLVDGTDDGIGGIVKTGSGTFTTVLDHVKAITKFDAVHLGGTTAGAAAIENSTLKAGENAVSISGAAHLVAIVSNHQTLDARSSYGDGSVDACSLKVRDGSMVFVDGILRAEHSDSGNTATGIDVGASSHVTMLGGSIYTANSELASQAKDVIVSGTGAVAFVPASVPWDRSKLTESSNGVIIVDATTDIAYANKDTVIADPSQIVYTRQGGGTLLTQNLTKANDSNVTSDRDIVGGATKA